MEDILEPSLEEELNNIKVLIKEPKRKYHDFWTSLFRNNNGLIDKINKEIPKDSDSWELWYLLFLAENNNLINLNPDNIRHKAAFKTAYELANANDKAFMDLELELYSNVKNIKGLDVILRSYQFGALEQILTNLVILIDNNKIEQDCHKLLKPLDTLFNMSDSVIKTNIQIIIINALFIKLGYLELEKMFNERINS